MLVLLPFFPSKSSDVNSDDTSLLPLQLKAPGAREEGGRLPGRRAGAARRYVRSRGAERALGRLPGAAPAELRGSGAAAVGRL